MIYELRTYTLVPGKQAEYLKLVGDVSRAIRGDNYGKLEGFWSTEFGTLNQVVHLWSYADLTERDRLRVELARNERWVKEYLPRSRPFVVAQENKILAPVVPFKAPANTGNVYELRAYRTQTGRAGEWLEHYKQIMPTREKYSKIVGLWQTEISQLNEVVHLWAYPDLNARVATRAKVMQDPEWQKFLGTATSLLAEMRSIVMNPAPFSPLR